MTKKRHNTGQTLWLCQPVRVYVPAHEGTTPLEAVESALAANKSHKWMLWEATVLIGGRRWQTGEKRFFDSRSELRAWAEANPYG